MDTIRGASGDYISPLRIRDKEFDDLFFLLTTKKNTFEEFSKIKRRYST